MAGSSPIRRCWSRLRRELSNVHRKPPNCKRSLTRPTRGTAEPMRILESLRVALSGLSSNRLRSVLTMLGIVIGVSAVIALVTLGQGFQDYLNNTFQSLGSNLVIVI